MQPLMFRCPRTGREIVSGLHAEHSGLMRLFTLRLRCPACEDLHEWHVNEGCIHTQTAAVKYPDEWRFVPECEVSSKILSDLGMTDREIAAYFRRFSAALESLRSSGDGMQYSLALSRELEAVERV
jgi:hypothetical protein